MTHVKALQAGHSSQGTSEPITPALQDDALQHCYWFTWPLEPIPPKTCIQKHCCSSPTSSSYLQQSSQTKKTLIRAGNRTLRIRWTTRTRNWTVNNNWRHILFSDDSRFNLSFDYGRVLCWRTHEEAYNPEPLHFRSQSTTRVTVWACINIHNVGQIIVVDGKMVHMKYMEVLVENLLHSVKICLEIATIPSYSSRITPPFIHPVKKQRWIHDQGINVIQWPAQSPYLNIVENLWDDIGRAIMRERPTNKSSPEPLHLDKLGKHHAPKTAISIW